MPDLPDSDGDGSRSIDPAALAAKQLRLLDVLLLNPNLPPERRALLEQLRANVPAPDPQPQPQPEPEPEPDPMQPAVDAIERWLADGAPAQHRRRRHDDTKQSPGEQP